jgi:nitrogen fixation protein NifU and related proteins
MLWFAHSPTLLWMNLTDIYRQIVLEHSRSPRNKGELDNATLHQHGVNPSCGDELELHLLLEDDQIVELRFTGVGCAISQASASLLTTLVQGATLHQARQLARDFQAMLHGAPASDALGDAAALQGVSRLHARVKCAWLAWQTLGVALDRYAQG